MIRLSKVLVVFVTAASLGFAAFAMALVYGGPNWEVLATAPELTREVAINSPQVPNGPYTAMHRRTGQGLKSSKNLAEVVVDGQKKVLDDLKNEVQQLDQLLQSLKPQLEDAQKLIEADRQGLNARAEAWSQMLQKLAADLNAINDQLQTRTVEATQVQADLAERRFEVLRLQNQLELLRDDLYAAEQQRDALVGELDLLLDAQQKLERRNGQLKQQLPPGKY
jgi:chromosome segregation ATPase